MNTRDYDPVVQFDREITLTCPQCMRKFNQHQIGALYGLYPTGFDDIFITVLCNNCIDVARADSSDPRRSNLKNRLEEYFRNPIGHPFHEAVAITSLKILEIHGGDIRKALEMGWPFQRAMYHYHVTTLLDGGIVLVSEKGIGDE